MSRRSLLSKAGAAAVAAVAAGTLLNPRQAKADDWDYVFSHGVLAWKHAATGPVDGPALGYAVMGVNVDNNYAAVIGTNQASAPGVDGTSTRGTGVKGTGKTGVWGSSSTTGHSGVYGQHTGSSGFGVVGDGKGSAAGVLGRNRTGTGVRGEGSTQAEVAGVRGLGKTGVWGSSSTTGYSGVYGQHTGTSGYGVVGNGTGGSAGILGRNSSGTGVRGEGRTGVSGVGSDDQQAGVKGEGPTGVWGLSDKTSYSGVYGEHTGTSGIGTVGIGKGGDAGVLGRNNTGVGVLGEGRNGVHGTGSDGYGGQFEGSWAQLRLVPKGTAGKPTSGIHQKGEIYVDSRGTLFVCTASGTPGTWRRVNTTAV